MAIFDTTRPTASGARISGILAGITATVSTWRDNRATRNELNKLSERELDDIGLTRGDVTDMFR